MASTEPFVGPDGMPWTPPTTEELLARGSAPVKREYLRPLNFSANTTAAAATATATTTAATGSGSGGGGGDGGDAGDGAAAPGNNGTTPGVRGSEHGVDKNRTGKSRRQQQREKQAARKNGGELCTAFVKGICTFPNCRYNHDVDLYVKAKQADLPGTCPFIAGGKPECPHGLMCRYFGSHPVVVEEEEEEEERQAVKQNAAEGDSADAKSTINAKPEASRRAKISPELAREMAAKKLTTTADGVLELPTPNKGEILDEMNMFPKDLKLRLRKGKVRFDRSDALLAELGVKTSWRYSSNKDDDGKGKGKGKDQKGGGKSDADWGKDSVEVGGGGGGKDADEDEDDDEEGGGKRRKAEDGSGIAAGAGNRVKDEDDNKAEGVDVKPRLQEKKLIDFRGKLYLVREESRA